MYGYIIQPLYTTPKTYVVHNKLNLSSNASVSLKFWNF